MMNKNIKKQGRVLDEKIIEGLMEKYNLSKDSVISVLNSTKENPIIDCKGYIELFRNVLENIYNIEEHDKVFNFNMPTKFKTSIGNVLPIAYLYDNHIYEGNKLYTVADNKFSYPLEGVYHSIEECAEKFEAFQKTVSLTLKYKYAYISSINIFGIYNNACKSQPLPDFRVSKVKYHLIQEINRRTNEVTYYACTKEALADKLSKVGGSIYFNDTYYLAFKPRKTSYRDSYKLELVRVKLPKYSDESGLISSQTIYNIDKIKEIYPKFFYFTDKTGKYDKLIPCKDNTVTVKGREYTILNPRKLSNVCVNMTNGFSEKNIEKAIERIKQTAFYFSSIKYELLNSIVVPCLNIYYCAGYIIMQQSIKKLYLIKELSDNDSYIRYFAMCEVTLTDYVSKYNHTNVKLNFYTSPCSYNKDLLCVRMKPEILYKIK